MVRIELINNEGIQWCAEVSMDDDFDLKALVKSLDPDSIIRIIPIK